MLILNLDIATSTGWSVFNTAKHPASTECGVLDLRAKASTGVETRRLMRRIIDEQVCALIDRYRPDVACLEQPLNYIKAGNPGGKKMPMFRGEPHKEAEEKGGPNADTVLMLNQLFASADVVCRHKVKTVIEVPPKTWQVLTKSYPGDTKERSIAFCQALGIILPPDLNKKERGDAADACVIGQWAAGHCQELRMMQRAAA